MKTCTKCGENKSRSKFNKNQSSKDGLRSMCKDCDHIRYLNWRDNGKNAKELWRAASKRHRLKKRYNMTSDDYERLANEQDRRCAICKVHESDVVSINEQKFHIDHDHDTGMVRGLLCSHCNRGLGCFKDDRAVLSDAINYLKTHAV